MPKFQLRGTATAMVTPFNDNLSIDFEAFEKLIDFQIEGGVEALVICGSTGESATLSKKEKMSLFVHAVDYSAGRIPVIAGTGSNNTQEAIDLSIIAKEHGADALLLVSPYYNKPSQLGLYNHFMAIAEQVDLPQIIYNVPGRSSVNIHPETQLKLAEDAENIIATKEASGDLEQIMQIIKYAPEGFDVISGDDALTYPIIASGGQGVISVISNYAPKRFSDMVRAALAKDFGAALKAHYELFELMQLNFIETNPVPVKTALHLMNFAKENFRLPLIPMAEQNKNILSQALKDTGTIK